TRPKTAPHSPGPGGNGLMAEALARLFYLTGKDDYRVRAERTIAAFSGELERNFVPLATLLNASELLQNGIQIVIAGPRDAADTRALLHAVHGLSPPNGPGLAGGPATAPPGGPPAARPGPVAGRPRAPGGTRPG